MTGFAMSKMHSFCAKINQDVIYVFQDAVHSTYHANKSLKVREFCNLRTSVQTDANH